jgi:hypothetical protein|tara:strand:+ start:574 stop:942 length:369 start_codon:yes stop_codon:yes gene_type:complete
MSNKYTTNKNAIADCDVCGFQFKLKTLKSLFVRETKTNILACTECWNPDQPQNLQGMYPVDDPQAVRNPRPDQSFNDNSITGSRDIQWGWNPVGGARPPTDVLTPNTLVSPVVIGTFTIAIT